MQGATVKLREPTHHGNGGQHRQGKQDRRRERYSGPSSGYSDPGLCTGHLQVEALLDGNSLNV